MTANRIKTKQLLVGLRISFLSFFLSSFHSIRLLGSVLSFIAFFCFWACFVRTRLRLLTFANWSPRSLSLKRALSCFCRVSQPFSVSADFGFADFSSGFRSFCYLLCFYGAPHLPRRKYLIRVIARSRNLLTLEQISWFHDTPPRHGMVTDYHAELIGGELLLFELSFGA